MSGECSLWWVDAMNQMMRGVSAWSDGRTLPGCGEWWPCGEWTDKITWTIAGAAGIYINIHVLMPQCAMMTTWWPHKSVQILWNLILSTVTGINAFIITEKKQKQNKIESVHHSNSQEKLCLSYYLKTNKTNLSFSKVSHVLFLKVFRKPVLSSAFCGNEWCCSLESCTLLVTIHLIMQKCEGVGCFLWFLVMGTKDSQTAIPSIL